MCDKVMARRLMDEIRRLNEQIGVLWEMAQNGGDSPILIYIDDGATHIEAYRIFGEDYLDCIENNYEEEIESLIKFQAICRGRMAPTRRRLCNLQRRMQRMAFERAVDKAVEEILIA